MIISIGTKISLQTAYEVIQSVSLYRVPEPVYKKTNAQVNFCFIDKTSGQILKKVNKAKRTQLEF